jgi:hypothetical protein
MGRIIYLAREFNSPRRPLFFGDEEPTWTGILEQMTEAFHVPLSSLNTLILSFVIPGEEILEAYNDKSLRLALKKLEGWNEVSCLYELGDGDGTKEKVDPAGCEVDRTLDEILQDRQKSFITGMIDFVTLYDISLAKSCSHHDEPSERRHSAIHGDKTQQPPI